MRKTVKKLLLLLFIAGLVSCTQEPVKQFEGHRSKINYLSISQNQKKIVSAGSDNSIRIWDVKTTNQLKVLKGHKERVNYAMFSPANAQLISSANDGRIYFWNPETAKIEHSIYNRKGQFYYITLSDNGKYIAGIAQNITDKRNELWLIDAVNTDILKIVNNINDGGCVFYNNHTVLFADSACRLKKINLNNNTTTTTTTSLFDFREEKLFPLRLSPNKKNLLMAKSDHSYKFYLIDIETGKIIQQFDYSHIDYMYYESIRFSPDGKYITFTNNGKIMFVNTQNAAVVETIGKIRNAPVICIQFFNDGKRIAISNENLLENKGLLIWETNLY